MWLHIFLIFSFSSISSISFISSILFVAVALGHFISALTGDFVLANAISAMLLMPFVLLGGFYLQGQGPPAFLIWLKEMSMFNWGFKLMVIDQFSGKTFECPPAPEPCNFPNGDAVRFIHPFQHILICRLWHLQTCQWLIFLSAFPFSLLSILDGVWLLLYVLKSTVIVISIRSKQTNMFVELQIK